MNFIFFKPGEVLTAEKVNAACRKLGLTTIPGFRPAINGEPIITFLNDVDALIADYEPHWMKKRGDGGP